MTPDGDAVIKFLYYLMLVMIIGGVGISLCGGGRPEDKAYDDLRKKIEEEGRG